MDVTVCKLPKKDASSFYRVLVEWSSDRFRITVLDEELMWCGKVSSTEVATISQQLMLTPQAYMSETRRALSTQGGAAEFVYVIENERFMWKKLVDNVDIKIRFGSVLLEVVPTLEMTEVMIDTIIDSNHTMINCVNNLEEEKEQLESENQELRKKLEELITKKIHIEETLYSNFLDILNAKKERIRKLEAHIERTLSKPGTSGEKTTSPVNCDDSFDKSDPDDSVVKKKSAVKKKKLVNKRSSSKSSSQDNSKKREPYNLSNRKQPLKSVPSKTSKPIIKRKLESKQEPILITKISPIENDSVDNHYDSDTDVDPELDEEDNLLNNASTNRTDSFSLDVPRSSFTLPKRNRQMEESQSCETTSTGDVRPAEVPAMDRDAVREFNTQQLLDELGV